MLPGLGLDDRIFHKLELPGYDIHYLNWMDPVSAKESIGSYAQRMADLIDPTHEVVLIGHSFGGVMAQEMARLIPVKQIILISSIKSGRENNPLFQLVGRLGLYHLFTKGLVVRTFFLWGGLYGYGGGEAQRLLEDMSRKNTNRYLRWALKRLAFWQAPETNTPIIHLHGTKDLTFPFRRILEPVIAVAGGRHFMVFQKAKQISELILKHLNP